VLVGGDRYLVTLSCPPDEPAEPLRHRPPHPLQRTV